MSVKNQKLTTFLRRNANYIIFLLCLAVITTVTVTLILRTNQTKTLNTNISSYKEVDNQVEKQPENTENDDKNVEDVATIVVFEMPVKNATITKDYTDSVCYNATLNNYTGHKAIDFACSEGESVKSCYDGTILSIEESKIDGIKVVISHNNELCSIYRGLEIVDDLEVGKVVKKGDVIGVVTNNYKKEKEDGAHLHFEVVENNVKINPNKYLLLEEK